MLLLFRIDSHHPLTLLSFLSRNGDETNLIPIGKKANRSLPSIVYRPRRLMEIEAAAAAAEKAKKEQFEKENIEKDQQINSQPPLRLTIPKPLVNDKPSSPIKKLNTNQDSTIQKKLSTNNISSSNNNIQKKIIQSPTINQSNDSAINNVRFFILRKIFRLVFFSQQKIYQRLIKLIKQFLI